MFKSRRSVEGGERCTKHLHLLHFYTAWNWKGVVVSTNLRLRKALNYVTLPEFQRDMYQHYAMLENVLTKLYTEEWWPSCCTNDRLNDQKESVNGGTSGFYSIVVKK